MSAPATRTTREQVPIELTWNLDHIYPSVEAWVADHAAADAELPRLAACRGRLGESAESLLAFLRARERLAERLEKLGGYARLGASVDDSASLGQALSARAQAHESRVGEALAWARGELIALPTGTLQRLLGENPGLAQYRRQIEDVLRLRGHILTDETEAAVAALDEPLDLPGVIWRRATAADMTFEPVDDGAGGQTPVSIQRWWSGLGDAPDRELRRRGYESLSAGLDRFKNTLASGLAAHIRHNVVMARLRGYASAADMILAPQGVPLDVYRNVLDVVHDGMAPHVRRLVRLRQRVLGIDQMRRYDLEAPLDPEYDPPTTFEEAEQVIREALRPLGAELDSFVAAAFRDRWVDRADNVGKRSGAFCSTIYGVHAYVFMSWSDRLRNVLTLAHELGHATHGMLAASRQSVTNRSSGAASLVTGTPRSLFFVEAPSTTSELMVGRHLLDTATDPRLRRFVVSQVLRTFTHNMVTHMLEAHFEQRLYDLAEADQPLTTRAILDVQGEVFARFFGDAVALDESDQLYWMQQPHFYVNFYPYTYSAGLAVGVNIAESIRREGSPAVDRWLETLRLGTTRSAVELAAHAGVDMTRPEPLERAVAFFGELVDELEQSYS